jgi:hypothetical protein
MLQVRQEERPTQLWADAAVCPWPGHCHGLTTVIGPKPVLPARWLLAIVVMVLPAAARDRYREEFRTELAEVGVAAQVAQASSLLAGSVALRAALNSRAVPTLGPTRRDWRCRLGRHRYVGKESDNPEMRGIGYLQCIRCGKRKDPPSFGVMPAVALGRGGG